jgi:hypothetical protein
MVLKAQEFLLKATHLLGEALQVVGLVLVRLVRLKAQQVQPTPLLGEALQVAGVLTRLVLLKASQAHPLTLQVYSYFNLYVL